ncbi:MAG: hypothetical protein KDA60_01415 [Planctomycetales bacterium]|nr:hypothetical protein [Planctomycetales bacterium]
MSSEESAAEKKPNRLRLWLSAPKRWTASTWATVLFAMFLVCSVIGCWIAFRMQQTYVPWRHYMTWPRLLSIFGLLAALPYVFHWGLRLWLQGEASRFPDVDQAWHAGLHALHEAGISLDETPLYVVTGSNSEMQERTIMNAHASPLSVVGVPKGPAPLHWYGNTESVYLFCSDTCWLSALNRLRLVREEEAAELALDAPGPAIPAGPMPAPTLSRVASAPRPNPAPTKLAPAPAGEIRGTMMLDQFVAEDAGPTLGGSANGNLAGAGRGTIMLTDPHTDVEDQTEVETYVESPQPIVSDRQPVVLPTRDSAVRLQRLQAVCQRLKNVRRPLCPVNGILTLLPFELIHATADETEEIERALQNDLGLIQTELQLRAPVTALVVGLEKEAGFRELVRRVGRDKSATQRFGGRFDYRASAVQENLKSFSAHVCGAFEDWAYTLFRSKDALSRPGNTRLYGLLCKVRCILKHKLGRILTNGMGFDPQRSSHDEPHLFSGCYFAATGRSQDRQAFVRGVLEKLQSEQEQIEWTDAAWAQERRCRKLFLAGIAVDVALVLTLAIRWFI